MIYSSEECNGRSIMKTPQNPENEAARLDLLCALNILDSPAEERFDRITRVAAAVFNVPIALITLIDEKRQWFKSRHGLELPETSRDISFCGHTILDDGAMLVPDALNDPRFMDNPLVSGEPHIRFYAGYPINGPGGVKLGTLCVIDYQPRTPTECDLDRLRDLALMVEGEIEKSALALTTKEREQELETVLRRMGSHIENSPMAVIEWDAAIRVIRWSRRGKDVLGWAPADVIGRHPHEWGLILEVDRLNFGHAMARLRNRLEPNNVFQLRHQRQDGSSGVCTWHNSVLFDEDGQLSSILSLVQDVTAQYKAEAALKQSAELFRATFEQAPVGIAHVGLDGTWLKVNQSLCDLLGYSREEMHSLTFQDITHPDDLAADMGHVRNILTGAVSSYSMEKRYIRKSGWVVWANLTVSLHRDASGRPLHFIAIVEDIEARKASELALQDIRQNLEHVIEQRTSALTLSNQSLALEIEQRREAEAAIAVSEERFRQILENSHEAFIGLDEQGQITDWNRQAEEVFGWKRAEVLGQSLGETIIPPDYRELHNRGMAHFLASGKGPVLNKRIELPALRRSGEQFPIEITIGVSHLQGKYHFGAFLHDISERKRAACEFERKQELLDAVLDSIDVGVVACDEEGRLTLFNRSTREFHGLPLKPVPAERWAEYYDLYDIDQRTRLTKEQIPLFRALRGEGVKDVEMSIVPKSGAVRHLSTSGRALLNTRGEKLGAVVAMHDITSRLQAERALRDSEQRLKTITDHLPALIAYVDTEERYRFNNKMYEDRFGVPVETLYGKTLREVLGDEDYAAIKPHVDSALKGIPAHCERRSGQDPEARYSEATFIPHRDGNNAVRGFHVFGVWRDRTQTT